MVTARITIMAIIVIKKKKSLLSLASKWQIIAIMKLRAR
jgi:hypothetical protein